MKKFLAILMTVAVMASATVDASAARKQPKVKSAAVVNMVKTYNHEDGFNVVSVGSLGLGLVKMIANAAAETEEDRAAVDVLSGLSKVFVLEYEDASQAKKDAFNAKMDNLLSNAEKILEVKDDGETVNIYGTSSEDGDRIEDLIIFVPDECALVCLFGSISAEKIAVAVSMNDE